MAKDGEGGDHSVSRRPVEIVFGALTGLIGGLAIIDALRLGIGWASDGPRAGFFPFIVGSILLAVSIANIVIALRQTGTFAKVHELKMVASLAVPATLYVGAIPFLGIFVPSALLLIGFVRVLGGYGWLTALAIAIGSVALVFVVFEFWFLISLPKGPIETLLGF